MNDTPSTPESAAMQGAGKEELLLSGPVVFIDGECLLCNRTVAFLAEHDPDGRLRFAHLQGALAERWLSPAARDVGPGGAVVLVEPELGYRVSSRSMAVLRTLGLLGGGWGIFRFLAELPGAARLLDPAYRSVAQRRDRWFGRNQECLIPTAALRSRFVENLESARPGIQR